MAWFKVDDQLAFNAKIVAAGNEAMGLWVRAGSWSAAQLTDGFVPNHMAIAMANGMAKECGADALVMAGLWHEVEGGYQFHDWSEFQPSAEAEKEKRRKRSLAGQKGAAARWGGKSHGKRHSRPHEDRMAKECEVDAPTRPDPTRPINTSSSEVASDYEPEEVRADVEELLDLLDAEIAANGNRLPNRNKTNTNAMRLLLDRDKATPEQVAYVIRWCQADSFWKANILSADKLRAKFGQLVAKIKADSEPRASQAPNKSEQRIDGHLDIVARMAERDNEIQGELI